MQMSDYSTLVREQVHRLAASPILRNSDTQRRLLLYLAEKSLEGSADRLKEYTVGIEALGKPQSYDPRQDPSVRIQTSKLRQRIDEYYRTEGLADVIRVDFPKGGFRLAFRESPEAAPSAQSAGISAERRWRNFSVALSAALAVCLAILAWGVIQLRSKNMTASEIWTPELQEIWEPFLSSNRPLLACLGTPLFLRIGGTGFFRSGSLHDWQDAQQSAELEGLRQKFPGRLIEPMHSFTGVGEAGAAFHLARALAAKRPDIQFARSNALSWEDIAGSNAVFLGPPKYVRHLKDIPVAQDFVVDSDAGAIRNLKPATGEPSSFPDRPGAPDEETHALISRLPGLHGRGEIFIFASNWTAGTLAAVQYATQPSYAHELCQRLRAASGELPRHYQVVVRLKLQNLYPIDISYVSHHVLNTTVRHAVKDSD
jgi:hypothetical protein